MSNTGQSTDGNSSHGNDRAQPFTTGSHAADYTLISVRFSVGGTLNTSLTQVRIAQSGSNNRPGGSLGTLTLTQDGLTVTTNENTAYTFSASDFNFSDTDTSDTLASVKITTLESAGELEPEI